ncbi:unnamed protein product, partial [Adineta ricciae]
YYGRRRLKNLCLLLLSLLILLILYYRRHDSKRETAPAIPIHVETRTAASPPVSLKRPGILSTIEFSNSPYLELNLFSSNTIPVLVLSRACNIEVRDAIRRTWGFHRSYRDNSLRLKIFFLVGTDDLLTERIRMEQNIFDDVIQVSIPDMYSFIAYKELSAMLWVRSYLPSHSFYLKTEDDVIINMKILVNDFLPIIESVYKQNIIIGWFGTEHRVPRGNYQKFVNAMIPPSSGNINYAMSLLYAMTATAADRIMETLQDIELIEYPGDPFVTGILRDVAKVQISNLATMTDKFQYSVANEPCQTAFSKNLNLLICTSSLHTGSPKSMPEYFDAWNVLIGET